MDHSINIGQGPDTEQYRATGAMIESHVVLSPGFNEFQNIIEEEVRSNPFLEFEGMDAFDSTDVRMTEECEKDPMVSELKCSGEANAEDFNRLQQYSHEEPTIVDKWDAPCESQNRRENEDSKWIENAAVDNRQETLEFHLLQQLPMLGLDRTVEDNCRKVIMGLDANGYFRQEVLFAPDEKTQFEIALRTVQKLDPPGVAARNLEECLLNQLDANEPDAVAIRQLISNHLKNIASKNLTKIFRETGLTSEQLENAIKTIRKLNPRPSSDYLTTKIRQPIVTPDLKAVTTMDSSGKIKVDVTVTKLNVVFVEHPGNATIRERLDFARKELKNNSQKRKLLELLRTRAIEYRTFLQMRNNTLKSVGDAIAKLQGKFFQSGRSAIVPMTKRQIAEIVNKDESTVSRAVLNKWIETPHGIFELDELFSRENLDIKRLVQQIIDEEEKTCPHSDEKLREILVIKHGMESSRRAIAQYREELGILNSRYRKN